MNSAVILAGGLSRRMGRDKLVLELDGRMLLESAVSRFSGQFDKVYLSVADGGKYPDVRADRIVDILPGAGPMSGVHAALTSLPGDGAFFVAADLPYSCPPAALRIIDLCGDNDACIIRLSDGRLEPLFGYYRKLMLPRCTDMIKSGDYRMTELVLSMNTRFLAPEELGALWNEKLIMNINTPCDYEEVVAKATD